MFTKWPIARRHYMMAWPYDPVCNVCQSLLEADGRYEAEAGMVQLRHFDGVNYFWDIGSHLFLQESKTDTNTEQNDQRESSSTIAVRDLMFPDKTSRQKFVPLYEGLSPTYLSGDIIPQPLKMWQEEDKTLVLFEKKTCRRPDLRWSKSGICGVCGCIEEQRQLWTEQNRSLVYLITAVGEGYIWGLGNYAVVKDMAYGRRTGAEEAAVNYVRQNTTIPVPAWIHSWHEGARGMIVMDRLPGLPYDVALGEREEGSMVSIWTEEERDNVEKEVGAMVAQLRKLTAPHAGTADGQLLRNAPFMGQSPESRWELPRTHEEAKQHWYELSLSGVSQSDLKKLDQLKETYPASEPFTFTHGDLAAENVMILGRHVSGIIDWEKSGFAPAWWERQFSIFKIPGVYGVYEHELNWMEDWRSIFETSWSRSLDRNRYKESLQEYPDLPINEEYRDSLKTEDPIRPPLPPYPVEMKDMLPPRNHQDMEGNWHMREVLPPIIKLPEFDGKKWRTQ